MSSSSKDKPTTIRVRAKGDPQNPSQKYAGFYGLIRRKPGDVFDIDAKHFSSKWMEKVTPSTPKTPAPGAVDQHDLDADAKKNEGNTAPAGGPAGHVDLT